MGRKGIGGAYIGLVDQLYKFPIMQVTQPASDPCFVDAKNTLPFGTCKTFFIAFPVKEYIIDS